MIYSSMQPESYAESIRRVVRENKISTCSIVKLKRLVFDHRKRNNYLKNDDYECLVGREPHKKWEHRIHGGLQNLKIKKEVKFLGNGNYHFLLK